MIFVAYAVIVLTLVAARADARAAGAPARPGGERGAPARATPRRGCGSPQAALERLEELADDAPEHVVQRLRDRYGSRVERLEARIEGDHDEHGQSDVAVAGPAAGGDDRGRARRAARRCAPSARSPPRSLSEIERELDLDESRLRARIRL